MAKEPDIVHAWLTRADERLEAAKLLLNEQLLDDAVSRAYYAMFSAAKAALISIGVETKSHTGLRNQFGRHFVQTGLLDARLAKVLATAFEVRVNSDYSISGWASQPEAETVIADAEQFVAEIKKFLSKLNDS
ncbi:MAG TPA: HEPN domain-containing protein [Anaerolineae bacterium]|nr:HEPN domain-containing protein [Anaerolineae bacterium]